VGDDHSTKPRSAQSRHRPVRRCVARSP
jgi:hypothetical protein